MIVTIHQPDFLPWLGFFNKVSLCEQFVIGDHVQFRYRGFTNRNRIKTAKGAQWLTVPILHDFGQPIKDVKVLETEHNGMMWYDQQLRTIHQNYVNAKYYDQYIGVYEKIYKDVSKGGDHAFLANFNLDLLKATFEILGIKVPIKKTSEMNLKTLKTESIIETLQNAGADAYISGIMGLRYMDESLFAKSGIKLLFNNYEHPTYQQQFMRLGFVPNMSVIDLIFNHGPESLDIIKSGFRGFEMSKEQREALTKGAHKAPAAEAAAPQAAAGSAQPQQVNSGSG